MAVQVFHTDIKLHEMRRATGARRTGIGPPQCVSVVSSSPPNNMKILVVNQFFYPDVSAVAQQLTDLAEDLTEAGDEVSVICGRGAYQPGAPSLPDREVHRGIRIRRVATRFGKRTLLLPVTRYLLDKCKCQHAFLLLHIRSNV